MNNSDTVDWTPEILLSFMFLILVLQLQLKLMSNL
jgi:hypothetical protein